MWGLEQFSNIDSITKLTSARKVPNSFLTNRNHFSSRWLQMIKPLKVYYP